MIAAVVVAMTVMPPTSAHSAPNFLAPWDCGITWHASTYPGHAGNGVDFNNLADGSDAGANVRASASGKATVHPNTSSNGYGIMVKIDHGGGWETRYAHLERLPTLVDREPNNDGIQVYQGDIIGEVGDTDVPGAHHLHYEQRHHAAGQQVRLGGAAISVREESPYTWTPDYPSHTSGNCSHGTPTSEDGTDELAYTIGGQVHIRTSPTTTQVIPYGNGHSAGQYFAIDL